MGSGPTRQQRQHTTGEQHPAPDRRPPPPPLVRARCVKCTGTGKEGPRENLPCAPCYSGAWSADAGGAAVDTKVANKGSAFFTTEGYAGQAAFNLTLSCDIAALSSTRGFEVSFTPPPSSVPSAAPSGVPPRRRSGGVEAPRGRARRQMRKQRDEARVSDLEREKREVEREKREVEVELVKLNERLAAAQLQWNRWWWSTVSPKACLSPVAQLNWHRVVELTVEIAMTTVASISLTPCFYSRTCSCQGL